MRTDNETSSEAGPPDSHEAMNNRDISPKIREKRSYEFLMGLINNNSRYEVTKVDPEVITESPKASSENVGESELLLELMVRIAAHPDQWTRVHKLLQNLDRDLKTSRNVVQNLNRRPVPLRPSDLHQKLIYVHKKENTDTEDSPSQPEKSREISEQDTENLYRQRIKWPTFDEEEFQNNFSESRYDRSGETPKSWNVPNKTSKYTYPKNFSYHRVTGKPIYLNKSPKAYIAVSVIEPKPMKKMPKDEDITLENQLHQLKPWTHTENRQNSMPYIRTKWQTQRDYNRTKSVVPSL